MSRGKIPFDQNTKAQEFFKLVSEIAARPEPSISVEAAQRLSTLGFQIEFEWSDSVRLYRPVAKLIRGREHRKSEWVTEQVTRLENDEQAEAFIDWYTPFGTAGLAVADDYVPRTFGAINAVDAPKPVPEGLKREPIAATSEWLPIDTAPKDGTRILLLRDTEVEPVTFGYWSMAGGQFLTPASTWVIEAIGWLPLPEAPTRKTVTGPAGGYADGDSYRDN